MDQSKMNFLQTVLKYSALNTDTTGSSPSEPNEKPDPSLLNEMEPKV